MSTPALPATVWDPVPGDVVATGETASKSIPIGTLPDARFLQVGLVEE